MSGQAVEIGHCWAVSAPDAVVRSDGIEWPKRLKRVIRCTEDSGPPSWTSEPCQGCGRVSACRLTDDNVAGENGMTFHLRRLVLAFAAGSLLSLCATALAADPEIDGLLKSPVSKDWITNGGNLINQRYSTLKQINTDNASQLKGAWMTRLRGSGMGGKEPPRLRRWSRTASCTS